MVNTDVVIKQKRGRKPKNATTNKVSEEKIENVKAIMPKKAVAVFARKRDSYGRNLDKNFYLRLIDLLKEIYLNQTNLNILFFNNCFFYNIFNNFLIIFI